jgi:hypothetical protein
MGATKLPPECDPFIPFFDNDSNALKYESKFVRESLKRGPSFDVALGTRFSGDHPIPAAPVGVIWTNTKDCETPLGTPALASPIPESRSHEFAKR